MLTARSSAACGSTVYQLNGQFALAVCGVDPKGGSRWLHCCLAVLTRVARNSSNMLDSTGAAASLQQLPIKLKWTLDASVLRVTVAAAGSVAQCSHALVMPQQHQPPLLLRLDSCSHVAAAQRAQLAC